MTEELFISGRNIPNIDPVLQVWHWPIPLYLFLGGLAAGILFFASFFYLQGKSEQYKTAVKVAPIIAPVLLSIGLMALLYDLTHKPYFWRLFTEFRIESPMSWGAWTLGIITPLSIVWAASFIKDIFPKWDWRLGILNRFEKFVIRIRKPMAWAMLILALITGVYTGILLSAFNARPLWNTGLLGPLFLVSGMSTGAAAIMWMSKSHEEKKMFSRIDLILIVVELFLITHLFMGFLAGSQVKIEAAQLFLGGEFTISFWVFVVGVGLLIPAILEILEQTGRRIPAGIPAFLILLGGALFRFIIVDAGQVTRYLY